MHASWQSLLTDLKCYARDSCQHVMHSSDSPECVNDHLALDALDGVHNNSHCSLVESFKALPQPQILLIAYGTS